jgi:hypothetical protein
MANKHLDIVELFEQLTIVALQIPRYAKFHAHPHSLSYFSVSLSSWRTSYDMKRLEIQLP